MLFRGRIASQTNADGGILSPLRESAQCFSFRVINSNTSCLCVRLPFTHDFMYAGTLGSNNTEKWVGHSMHHSFHRFPMGACYVPAWVPWEHGRGCDLDAAALGTLQAAGGNKPRTQHLVQARKCQGPWEWLINALKGRTPPFVSQCQTQGLAGVKAH